MERLEMEYKFTLQDFEVMEKIEHSYFPDDSVTVAKEVFKWYEKNNLTCIGVRNSSNEIIASVNILPLRRETFLAIYENRMNEVDVVQEQIEEYEDNHSCYIYLSAISIDKKYRNQYKVMMTLLKGCIELLEILKKRNIKIEQVMADASTIHGEKICRKLLNMNYITNTSHQSKIYCTDGENMLKAVEKIRKFID